jgi:hypothetical protein
VQSIAVNSLTVRTLRAERLVLQTHANPEDLCRHFVFVQGQEEREAAFAMRQRMPVDSSLTALDVQAMFRTRRAAIVRTWSVRHTMAVIHHADVALAAGAVSVSSNFDRHSRTSRDTDVPPAMVTRALDVIRTHLAATDDPIRIADIVEHLAANCDRRFADEWRDDVTQYSGLVHRSVARGEAILCGRLGSGNAFTHPRGWCRTPPAAPPARDAVVRTICLLYFEKYGPATVADANKFMGAGGVTTLRAIVVEAESDGTLQRVMIDDVPHWCTPTMARLLVERHGDGDAANRRRLDAMPLRLLPAFDMFTIAFAAKEFYFHNANNISNVWRSSAIVRAVVFWRGFLVGVFHWKVLRDVLTITVVLWDDSQELFDALTAHATAIAPWFGATSAQVNRVAELRAE